MTQRDKLLTKLSKKPKDFTWAEFELLMKMLGYQKCKPGRTGGSRRRFVHETMPPIILHEPHPTTVLKSYQIEIILELLQKEGIL